MRSLAALAAVLVLGTSSPVLSQDEVKAESAIDSVTVFPQGAEITRTVKVKLETGDHRIVVQDLSAALIPESIRVQGEATGTMSIGAVDTRKFFLTEANNPALNASERKRLETELQKLFDERQSLQDTVNVAETQKQLMVNLAASPARSEPAPTAGVTRPPAEWGEIFVLIGDRLAAANKAIQQTAQAMRDLDRRIGEVQSQLNLQPSQEDQRTELRVSVGADQPLDATLRIRYQVADASWWPVYDVRLSTGDEKEPPKLTLIRRAIIAQSSGEDWTDVALALSTTRPQAGTSIAELGSMIVAFQPEQKPVPVAEGTLRRKITIAEQDEATADFAAAAPQPVSAVEQQARIATGAFQATYIINDRQSVKTGEGDKRVQIDTQSAEAVIGVRAIPKLSDVAYLYATFKLAGDVQLLPGQASLFRDDIFVGYGSVPHLASGEEHELGFGADDGVRIKFATLDKTTGESGIISSSKTETQQFRMTIKNLHRRAVPVRVIDQLPVSSDEKIEVQMLSGTTKPSVTDLDGKRGLLAWDFPIEPDGEQEITFGYQVSWPQDQAIEYREE